MLHCTCFEAGKLNKQPLTCRLLLLLLLRTQQFKIHLSVLCQADIMVSKKMAARPQSKVASRAAGCNYEPAEDPARPQTLLEQASCNLHPFETISLRSASRGHDTEEWKHKKRKEKKTPSSVNYSILVARSTLVIYCERSMEHLGRNWGCNICRQRGRGGGEVLLTGPLEKWWQVFTKWQLFWILSIRRSWAETFISGSLCLDADLSPRPLLPSFLWSQHSPPEGRQPATVPK